MKSTNFSCCFALYFDEYLPKTINLNVNTIDYYLSSFRQLFIFCRDVVGVPYEKLTFKILDDQTIIRFLDWLQTERQCISSTINGRLRVIQLFFRYAQIWDPALGPACQKILQIPFKKHQPANIRHLTLEQTRLLLAAPKVETKMGLRDTTLLNVLYDSAARVSEILDLRVKDVRLDRPALVTLTGMDGKTRSLPLSPGVVKLLGSYMAENRHILSLNPDMPLFFSPCGSRLAHTMVGRIVRKRARALAARGENIPQSLSPGVLRHTKAMRLYQSGMSQANLCHFLGHSRIFNTNVYVRADLESKRKELDEAYSGAIEADMIKWRPDDEEQLAFENIFPHVDSAR
jgi:site-specific recombinase XerD